MQLTDIVLDPEIQVGLAGHQDGLGSDRAQRLGQIAPEPGVSADVRVHPGPEHGQQIVGVPAQEVPFPGPHEVVLQRGEARLAPRLVTVEFLAHAPAGIDAAHGAQAGFGLGAEVGAGPMRIGGQGGLDAFQEDLVVRRGAGGPADGEDTLDLVREHGAPMHGLLRAHGPAIDHGDPVDAEFLRHQTPLGQDIVIERELGVTRLAVGRFDIAGRGREAAAEHIGNDDEKPLRVQNTTGLDQPFNIGVLRPVAGRVDDRVALGPVQRAIGFIGQDQVGHSQPGLQNCRSQRKILIVGHWCGAC